MSEQPYQSKPSEDESPEIRSDCDLALQRLRQETESRQTNPRDVGHDTGPRVKTSEILVRADLERARVELRLGRGIRCEAALDKAEWRIRTAARSSVNPTSQSSHIALRGVALSLRGQSMLKRGRTKRAAELTHQAICMLSSVRDDALMPSDHGDFGVALAVVGRDEEARRQLRQAVVYYGAPPEFFGHLARLELDIGRTTAAGWLVEQALRAIPDDAELHRLRADIEKEDRRPEAGQSYLQAGRLMLLASDPMGALKAFDEAANRLGDSGEVLGLRGEALRLQNEPEAALEALDQAVRVQANSAWLLIQRAATLGALGDWNRAEADLDRALDLEPENPDVLVLAGYSEVARGNLEGAHKHATRALSLDPENSDVLELRAHALHADGNLAGAIEFLREAVPFAQPEPQLLRLYADFAMEASDWQTAIDLLERVRSESGGTIDDLLKYAAALAEADRLREALHVTDEGVQSWPDERRLRKLRAELLLQCGDLEHSVEESRAAVARDPDDPESHLLLVAALLQRAHFPMDESALDELSSSLRTSMELAPDSAEPLYFLARLDFASGAYQAAEEAAREALQRDPRHRRARELLVDLKLMLKETEDAEELARELVDEWPDDANELALLARVLVARHHYDEALAHLAKAVMDEVADGLDRVGMLLLRAQVRASVFRLADSEADLASAAALAPDRAEVWTLRAMVARMLGNYNSAGDFARKALELDPEAAQARVELAAAYTFNSEANKAQALLEEISEQPLGDVSAELLRAQLVAASDPQQGRTILFNLAASHPESIDVAVAVAQLHLDLGEYDRSLDVLFGRADTDPPPNLLAVRAEAHRMLRQLPEAIDDANHCLQLVDAHPDALTTLGLALLGAGDDEGAQRVFERAVSGRPQDQLARARLGYAYAFSDRLDDSLSLLEEAALAMPTHDWVIASLADILSQIGRFAQAAALYRQICDRSARDPFAWNGLGWSLLHHDPPLADEAEYAFLKAGDLAPDDPWSRRSLANTYQWRGERERARVIYADVLERARARRMLSSDYASLAAWCAFRLGDMETAARDLYSVTISQKVHTADHFDLALVHVCDGRVERGVSMYLNLLPLTDRDAQRRRGLLSVARFDLLQAMRDYSDLSSDERVLRLLAHIDAALDALPDSIPIRVLGERVGGPAPPRTETSDSYRRDRERLLAVPAPYSRGVRGDAK